MWKESEEKYVKVKIENSVGWGEGCEDSGVPCGAQ